MAYQASGHLPGSPPIARPSRSRPCSPRWSPSFLGIAVVVLAFIALWLATSDDSGTAATSTAHDHAGGGGSARSDAELRGHGAFECGGDRGAAHKPYPAEMPALQPGPVANIELGIVHRTVSIAPGIKYDAWAFDNGVLGPPMHVREGQRVNVTMTNNSPIPHSIDFHAARIAPNVAFRDIAPGKSFKFSFVADDPGVYMYHCGTKPVLAHIVNRMYGAIVVEPKAGLPPADREYVLVAASGTLSSPGLDAPASLDMVKAHQMTPDWVTWNGTPASTCSTRSLPTRRHRALLGRHRRAVVRHRVPRRRHHLQPRLGEPGHDAVPAGCADRVRPGWWRRRLRREDRRSGLVPLRVALVRERRHGARRVAQGRQPAGDDGPLDPDLIPPLGEKEPRQRRGFRVLRYELAASS